MTQRNVPNERYSDQRCSQRTLFDTNSNGADKPCSYSPSGSNNELSRPTVTDRPTLSCCNNELPRPTVTGRGIEFSRERKQFNSSPVSLNEPTKTTNILDEPKFSNNIRNYFTSFNSQEDLVDNNVNKNNLDKIKEYGAILRGRPKPAGRYRRSYSCSTSSTRPLRSRSHSPVRKRFDSDVQLLKPNFELSRSKFPSDSEISRKFDQDFEFSRTVRIPQNDCELYELPLTLPKPHPVDYTT